MNNANKAAIVAGLAAWAGADAMALGYGSQVKPAKRNANTPSGDQSPQVRGNSRNKLCPCGCGRKAKRCPKAPYYR